MGRPADEDRQAGVGFATRTSLLPQLASATKGIYKPMMSMRIRLANGSFATARSVYAPTMSYAYEFKEEFYETLSRFIHPQEEQDFTG